MKIKQKFTLFLMPLLIVGCISSQPFPQGVVEIQPQPIPQMRAPRVGQEWVYQVRNVFNQEIIDTITEKVVSVGNEVRIARSSAKTGPLPDEIQSPWGFVTQDPHWRPAQIFTKPIPLWPPQLSAGWNGFFTTQYQVPSYPDSKYYWGLGMTALQWERIKTSAGEFLALQVHNDVPNFVSNDLFRLANERQEDLWFAPEVGRWVIRRSSGRYITAGVYWSNAYWEDYLQWELISWK
ncbi:hypothetical protein [Polynucleobacter sp. MWH-Braz-FAM2G]|uniref:hypothetical protein n=1 Tax=Polynucleobacter sp. MWH-Braz-FAM2G TaxID=1855883 RepID=UPI001BFECB3C|nr:hypothetical protein [Polynucleobacter sp. MWH-Braz-FAM2G]QWD91324.1 hypothetical protein FD973_03050 [Polynucleobacter sp. MWH-Braz-FAM2G]